MFDGPFGLNHLVHSHSNVNWEKERLDVAEQVSIKRYNTEFQSQSAVDAVVELQRGGLCEDQVTGITLDVAKGA